MRGSAICPGCPHLGFVAVAVVAVGQRDQGQAGRAVVGERTHFVVGVVGVLIIRVRVLKFRDVAIGVVCDRHQVEWAAAGIDPGLLCC
jgi:hypothetical protein